MATEIKMPNLGSDMTEGMLLNWMKQVGDTLNVGDVIAEIETDKATVEVPSEVSGTIVELKGNPGDTLQVGSVIGYVGAAGEAAPASGGAAPAPAASAPATQVAPPDAEPAKPAAAASQQAPAAPAAPENGNLPGGKKASPLARNIAAERGIDLGSVQGTGPGGRITKSDVLGLTPDDMPAAPVVSSTPAPAASSAVAPAGFSASYGELPVGPDVEIIDVTKIRTRIAKRMVESKQQIPHFYVTSEMDVEALLNLRKQLNANVSDEAQKVTVNDLIVKAVALALRQFPNLNTHFYGDKMARHKRIHIGIAVALPNGGLVNVVAKDADKTSLGTMAAHNKEMIARARDGKVKPDDVQGSTFTVSNLGSFDVDVFQAIVNPPEAAILAVGSAKQVPIVKADGSIGIGSRMKVTVSVDHRVSDGAEGAQFMQAFKALIENPMRLVL